MFLLSITWIMRLESPLFSVLGNEFSGKDMILIAGGLFLMGKATYGIHHKIEASEGEVKVPKMLTLPAAIAQIILVDMVFSVDSVITAVGLARDLWVMITAVLIAIVFMMAFAGSVSKMIDTHPSLKVLALAFLVLIGFNLMGEGFGYKIPKGYTYFAMAFSLAVEVLNIRLQHRPKPPVACSGGLGVVCVGDARNHRHALCARLQTLRHALRSNPTDGDERNSDCLSYSA